MEETNLMVFAKKDISSLLDLMGIKTTQKKKQAYIYDDSQKQIALCHGCGVKIKKKKLGNIIPGSKLFFCDNPTCFAAYIAQNKV